MTSRDIINYVVNIFERCSPRSPGFLFDEKYRLQMIAEMSAFTGCKFCNKEERASVRNDAYIAICKKWKHIESNEKNEEIGKWWNELRETLIMNEESELEFIKKRNYRLCTHKTAANLTSYLVLLNWKYLARNVMFPIIYRIYCLVLLLICFVVTVLIICNSKFVLIIRFPFFYQFLMLV